MSNLSSGLRAARCESTPGTRGITTSDRQAPNATVMRAWTDYPIVELGDKPGKLAPIRLVDVISYDRNKYCRIRVAGVIDLVKRGYLYKQRGRVGEVETVSNCQLNKLPHT